MRNLWGVPPFGTVIATDIGAGEVQILVTLKAGETFAQTGLSDFNTLLWNLSRTPILTDFTDVSSNVPVALASTTAGSIFADGSGTWEYAINCPTCGPGMIPPTLNSPIIFDISATGLSTASFVQNDNFLFFAAEISGNFNNFVVGAPTEIISAVPLPAALPLFATGLGALGLLGWRRKKAAAG